MQVRILTHEGGDEVKVGSLTKKVFRDVSTLWGNVAQVEYIAEIYGEEKLALHRVQKKPIIIPLKKVAKIRVWSLVEGEETKAKLKKELTEA